MTETLELIERKYRWLEVKGYRTLFRFKRGTVKYREMFRGKHGLEIGGPTPLFDASNILPLYSYAKAFDCANYAQYTIWDEAGGKVSVRYEKEMVCEAGDLKSVESKTYDFVLSSNCIEHLANPIKAIQEWVRVTKPGGFIVMVVPRKESNFDHRRPLTSFVHLLEDFKKDMPESDLTHLEEVLALHDHSLGPPAGTPEEFKQRSLKNLENRALHHHVFDLDLLKEMTDYCGLEILHSDNIGSDYVLLTLLQ